MHALIIESDTWVVLAIEDALTDMGYTSFDCATSATDAERLARDHCPDLITSAIHIGQECGFAAVRSARARRCIPFVFVTATSWEASVQDRRITVVQKPFSAQALMRAVRAAVSSPMPASW
ncbi:MAG TPA: response regulator [Acidobacteriaceae bacterium]|nr:response regulator [Acidobacteriaceae bacterium]